LDSTILSLREQLKRLRSAIGWTLLFPLKTAGVAQLVEHHLAKVAVASSSLVTRSIFPCICGAEQPKSAGLERTKSFFKLKPTASS
jgi:hypothetical protein